MDSTKNDALCYFSMRTASNANKQTATQSFEYINRLDSTLHRKDLIYSNSINMPAWANNNPAYFWAKVTKHESYQGRHAVTMKIALPNALSLEENIKLMNEFANGITTYKEGLLPCSFALHFEEKENPNPHFHLMLYERPISELNTNQAPEIFFTKANRHYPKRGGIKKVCIFKKRDVVKALRKFWARIANKYLKLANCPLRMNPLSYKERGIAKIPQIHLGSKLSYFHKQGLATSKGKINEQICTLNEQLEKMDLIEHAIKEFNIFCKECIENDFKDWRYYNYSEKETLFRIYTHIQNFLKEKTLEELISFYLKEYDDLTMQNKLENILKNLIVDGYSFEKISKTLLPVLDVKINSKKLSELYNWLYHDSIQDITWVEDVKILIDELQNLLCLEETLSASEAAINSLGKGIFYFRR